MRARNLGWRLDYMLITKEHINYAVGSSIHKECEGSDHVPIQLQLDLKKMQDTAPAASDTSSAASTTPPKAEKSPRRGIPQKEDKE